MGGSDARPTTASPGAERPDGLRPSGRELAGPRGAAPEPTLAEANEDFRKIVAAGLLMQEWDVTTIAMALRVAGARVRGARRRSGL